MPSLPFMPCLGLFLQRLGAGGGKEDYKKAASKEAVALIFQPVPSSIDKVFVFVVTK